MKLPEVNFINRKYEIDQFKNFLEETDRTGLLLTGPPGTGKTALLHAFSKIASELDHWVHWIDVRYYNGSGELIYGLAKALLSGREVTGKSPDQWKSILKSTVSLKKQFSAVIDFPTATDSIKAIIHLIENIIFNSDIGQSKKLVLIFDSIDAVSHGQDDIIFTLESLLKSLTAPIKLIFSSRTIPSISRLSSYYDIVRYELAPLNRDAVYEFIERIYGKPSKEIDRNIIESIYEQTEGSPLLLSQYSKYIKDIHKVKELPKDIFSFYDNFFEKKVAEKNIYQDAKTFLKAVAVTVPNADLGTLKELTRFSNDRINRSIDTLSRFLIKDEDENYGTRIYYFHKSFHEYVINRFIFPDDFEPENLDFGAEEAERDKLLISTFIFNNAILEIVSGKKTIILGDRGSGKSSLYKFFKNYENFSDIAINKKIIKDLANKLIVFSDDPENSIQNTIFSMNDESSPEIYKSIWLLFIAILSGAEVYRNGNYQNPEVWKQLKKLLKRAGVLKKLDFLESENFISEIFSAVSKVGSKISFSIAGIPINLEPTLESKSDKKHKTQEVDIGELLRTTNTILRSIDRQIYIMIDRIDELFKYEREKQEALIQGLFLAESQLSNFTNIEVIIFLRSDLFEIYDIREKNKFVSRSIVLKWNQNNLIQMMLKRVYSNSMFSNLQPLTDVNEIFPEQRASSSARGFFPEEIEGLPLIKWFIEKMKNGNDVICPRQIILLLNLLRDIVISTKTRKEIFPIFKTYQMEQAMSQLSELCFEEFLNDFRVATTFIRNCRAGKIKNFDIQEIKSFFDLDEGPIHEQMSLLEKLGFLFRVIIADQDKGYEPRFLIPDLYTRCWDMPI